jgi:hypothetical protein
LSSGCPAFKGSAQVDHGVATRWARAVGLARMALERGAVFPVATAVTAALAAIRRLPVRAGLALLSPSKDAEKASRSPVATTTGASDGPPPHPDLTTTSSPLPREPAEGSLNG